MPDLAIADYGLLSDRQTAALVSRAGAVDWYCPSRFDAPAVFARLLDAGGGTWEIRPVAPFETTRRYLNNTLVLQTTFTTAGGEATLTDALAFAEGARGHLIGKESPHLLLRQISGVRGEVTLQVTFCPRPEYALSVPLLNEIEGGVYARAGSLELVLMGGQDWQVESGVARTTVTVRAGETVGFSLLDRTYRDENAPPQPVDVAAALENVQAGWQSWADQHWGDECQGYQGLYQAQVHRSALVLQALTYQPTGAVVAAATTALPEVIGGESNWDYRFVWLRDLTLTMRALWVAACPDEVERFFRWVDGALGDVSAPAQPVQIVYGVEGERDLTEHALDHLSGYRESRPVRIGNDAWRQKQLDVLGEVVDSIFLFREQIEPTDGPIQRLVVQLADRAAASWHQPDAGMWEARDRERHYLTSKVMCWVALDRAIRLAPQLGEGVDPAGWQRERDAVRQAIFEHGWNANVEAFTGAFGSDHLDASVLLLPLVGFLPATDPRMAATIRTVERELTTHGQVHRWHGDEHGFLLCTYWLVECLALLGDQARARRLFEETTAYANDLGLLAEMVDPKNGELIGNFPQAFSHIGLINAAWRLTEMEQQPQTPGEDADTGVTAAGRASSEERRPTGCGRCG